MQNRALELQSSEAPDSTTNIPSTPSSSLYAAGIPIQDLERLAKDYLLDCEFQLQSPSTVETRRIFLRNLLRFLRDEEHQSCGTSELKEFFLYLRTPQEGGRWGQKHLTRPLRPISIKDYYVNLRCFFNYLIKDGAIEVSPLHKIPVPVVRTEQKQPLSAEQVLAMLNAAKHCRNSKRDIAILHVLFDTGLRASEVCNLKVQDLDLHSRSLKVLGKGNKVRIAYIGQATAKSLWNYLRKEDREPNQPLFLAERGVGTGSALTRSGLLHIIERIAQAAGVPASQCSVHAFRRTFAVEFLRGGGNSFSLQNLLGHSNIQMTQKYVSLAQADLEHQHRQFSPADRLRKGAR